MRRAEPSPLPSPFRKGRGSSDGSLSGIHRSTGRRLCFGKASELRRARKEVFLRMVIRINTILAGAAVAAMWLTGCATATRHESGPANGPQYLPGVDQNVVEAHAHYAMATMYEVD